MNKRWLLLIGIVLALAVIAILEWQSLERNNSVAELPADATGGVSGETRKVENEATKSTVSARNDSASTAGATIAPTVSKKHLYQIAETKSSFDPVADAKQKKRLPFRMLASGGTGKIVDAAGNVIVQSDPKNAIFSCDVSPDQTRIAINRGSGKYDIMTPSTGETIRLPQKPPGENVLGFSWRWIDDQTLVGVSGIITPFRNDQVGPEREEPNISRSLLYVYDLKKQEMSEVELPPMLRAKTFSVSAIDDTGKVQLQREDREASYAGASLGWFEIRPAK